MRYGIKPHTVDARDYSFHRTFPVYGAIVQIILPDLEYNYDAGLSMPNQDIAEPPLTSVPYPNGCTGFASTDVCGNEDKDIYLPGYTYAQTCFMEGHDITTGCDMRTAMKSLTIYGLAKAAENGATAQTRKRGQYFNIDKLTGRDWFDSFRIALRANALRHSGISCGTIWFPEWGDANQNGILTAQFIYNGKPLDYGWHDYVISGEKIINGESYFCIKSWQGRNYGDHGWVYMNRETFNKAFDIYGTIGLMPGTFVEPGDIRYVQLALLQQLLIYLNRLLSIIGKSITVYA